MATTAPGTIVNGERDAVLEGYLAVINLLSCSGDGWVLSGGKDGRGSEPGKRKLVTLEDVRKKYQDELDRRSLIENGRFGFGEGEAMDVI